MLNTAEVAKHNSRQSCWIIVEGQVYDVTEFLEEHPGGPNSILAYAGRDATEVYEPIHPHGTIEKTLPTVKRVGQVERHSTASVQQRTGEILVQPSASTKLPLELCMCLNDFEKVAKSVLSERAWIYFSSATEDLISLRHNLLDWQRFTFRPRVLRDVRQVNLRQNILGHQSSLPIFIAPAALARLGHPDGELCLARGAAAFNIPYVVSTGSSVALGELMRCVDSVRPQSCLSYQLYVKKTKSETLQAIRHARLLGFKTLVVTVDTPIVGKRDEDDRFKSREILSAGASSSSAFATASSQTDKPNLPVGSTTVPRSPFSSTLDWDDLNWIRDAWGSERSMGIKGVTTAEDALLAMKHGVNIIYLSNHGGRQLDSAPSALRTLLDIRQKCPEVLQHTEVLVDGGVRRGTDVLKALCLGAKGVGLGRPYLYAMSSYGTEGVYKAIQIMTDELETSMRLLGVTALDQLGPHVIDLHSTNLAHWSRDCVNQCKNRL